jgi:hypothetical protein
VIRQPLAADDPDARLHDEELPVDAAQVERPHIEEAGT